MENVQGTVLFGDRLGEELTSFVETSRQEKSLPENERGRIVFMVRKERRHFTGIGRRVLVVDSDASVRNCLARIFDSAGFDTITVSDGLEALQVFRKRRFAFAMIEVDLGLWLDGITVGLRLKEIDPELPVVITSENPARAANVAEAGLDRFLERPVDFGDIKQLLREVGSRRRRSVVLKI